MYGGVGGEESRGSPLSRLASPMFDESRYIAGRCPAAAKSHSLTKAEGEAHLAAPPNGSTPRRRSATGRPAVAAAVDHLGYVQIDTINVIERCHHHILYTRIPAYRRADLRQAQSVDKSVFEYWTHALSYVPSKDFRFFVPAMKLHQREGHRWFSSVKPADMRKVMRLIRQNGALTIRDIEDDVLTEKEHLWASRKPSKRALQLAFYEGRLTISERNGMLKTYELMARHFGWDKPPKAASATETTALSARPRVAGAGGRQPGFDLSPRRAEQEGDPAVDRAKGPAQRAGAGRARRRGQAGALGAPGSLASAAKMRAKRHSRTGAHPLAVRSPDHPAQAHPSVLRLRAPLRGLCAEGEAPVRLFRAAGAGRQRSSSPRSI